MIDFKLSAKAKVDYRRDEKQVIHVDGVKKVFRKQKMQEIDAVQHASFIALPGEFIIIYGPSGCGKSTLLHTIAGLERPTAGKVILRGRNIYKMHDSVRNEWRARNIGTLFQRPIWVNTLSVEENVALPLMALGCYRLEAVARAKEYLNSFRIDKLGTRHPSELSGGEMALAGLARTLIADPWLLLLDEPTGNLDSRSAKRLMNLLIRLNKDEKKTVIMVTHNLTYLPYANRSFSMYDGSIIKTVMGKNLDEVSRLAEQLEKVITTTMGTR